MSIVVGGKAGFNSVSFSSKEKKVTAYRNKKGEIKIKVSSNKKSNFGHFGSKLEKIPFLRGAWFIFEGWLGSWKISLPLFLFLLSLQLINYRHFKSGTNSMGKEIYHSTLLNWYTYILLIGLLFSYSLFIKLSHMGKYHAAEHMVDNAFENSNNISITNVLKYSRIHHRCGTNLLVFIILFHIIFSLIFTSSILCILLGCIFGYEVFKINNKRINFLFRPFYILGYFLQKYLFTSLPEKKHIEVAIVAYDKIIYYHNINSK